MKRKIHLLIYAIAISLWPIVIGLGLRFWFAPGDLLGLFMVLFNWILCLFLIPMGWWGWFDHRPRVVLTLGVILCLPIVFYNGQFALMVLNLAFGGWGIGLGLLYRAKPNATEITPNARLWNLIYLLLTLSLPLVLPIHYLFFFPHGNFGVFDYATQMVPMIGVVLVLVVLTNIFKEPIFAVFSVLMLLFAAATLNDFILLRLFTFGVAMVGLTSFLIGLPKVKKQETN